MFTFLFKNFFFYIYRKVQNIHILQINETGVNRRENRALGSHREAAEAVNTIGTHHIDDIVVLDEDNQPIGLIDTQDGIYGGTVAWTGRHVLFFGGYARSAFLAWDPAAGGWTVLPPDRPRIGAVSAWTGQHLIVWGAGTFGPDVETAIWLPPDDWCHPTADGRPSCP